MAKTKIEWTGKNGYTWNPVVGCSHASPGCLHCYAETYAGRLAAMGIGKYQRVVERNARGMGKKEWKGEWNGKCCLELGELEKPFHWKAPRHIFVSSMGDLFHENVPFEWIDKVMAVIALNPRHTFLILTKRPERMREYFYTPGTCILVGIRQEIEKMGYPDIGAVGKVLLNLHLGVTAENQEMADLRIPILLGIPAALRFVSIEPMLGPVDLMRPAFVWPPKCDCKIEPPMMHGLDWVILGMETGHGARTFPGAAEAIVRVKDQCQEAGVTFFYKGPMSIGHYKDISRFYFCYHGDGKEKEHTIDGVEYRQFPQGA